MSVLYNRIDDLCKKNRITVTLMCKDTGISRAALSDLKFGRSQTLSIATINKVAKYFNVSVDDLLNPKKSYALGETDDLQASDRPQPSELDLQILQKLGQLSEEDRLRAEQFIDFMLAQHNQQPPGSSR